MAREKVEVRMVVSYVSHTMKRNETVSLSLKAMYDELPNCIQLLQLLEETILLGARTAEGGWVEIGAVSLSGISFDKNGVSTIKLSSLKQSVDSNAMNSIVTMEKMPMKFIGYIDVEDEWDGVE